MPKSKKERKEAFRLWKEEQKRIELENRAKIRILEKQAKEKVNVDLEVEAEEKAQKDAEELARQEFEEETQRAAKIKAQKEADEKKARKEADEEEAKIAAEQKATKDAEEKARKEFEEKTKLEMDKKAKKKAANPGLALLFKAAEDEIAKAEEAKKAMDNLDDKFKNDKEAGLEIEGNLFFRWKVAKGQNKSALDLADKYMKSVKQIDDACKAEEKAKKEADAKAKTKSDEKAAVSGHSNVRFFPNIFNFLESSNFYEYPIDDSLVLLSQHSICHISHTENLFLQNNVNSRCAFLG